MNTLPPQTLPRRTLGTTGLSLSILGLGTVKLGRDQGLKYPVGIPTDDQFRELLSIAKSSGLNFIDTAPAYGTSEARLGQLLHGQREDWTIATKVGESFDDGISTFDFSPPAITASIERSLTRLKTTYIDIALVHSDGLIETNLIDSGVIDALQRLAARGLIRTFGASTKTLHGALEAAAHCPVVMLTLNPSATADLPAIEAAATLQRGVIIKKAFASGQLLTVDTSPLTCLRFALAPTAVASVVIGTTSPTNLAANIAAALAAVTSPSADSHSETA